MDGAELRGLRALHDTMPRLPCYVVAPLKRPQRIDFALAVPPLDLFERIAEV